MEVYVNYNFYNFFLGGTCSGWEYLPAGDEEALKQAVASIGPISIAYDVVVRTFRLCPVQRPARDQSIMRKSINNHR